MKVKRSRCARRAVVTADGANLVSHAGMILLGELADRSGLTAAMSDAMAGCGISWHTHDPGVVLTHVAIAIADGADCLSDLATVRETPELFGLVASQATAWRAIEAVTAAELRGITSALASARAAVWAGAGLNLESLTFDFDATLVTAHSDKQDAAPNYKRGFGFHPFGLWLDETREPLAAMLRPGNAGANSAWDHEQLLIDGLAGLPERYRAGHGRFDDPALVTHPILARADSAGSTHDFVAALTERNIDYSLGFAVDGRIRDALLLVQDDQWEPARNTDDGLRKGAYIVELTDLVDLDGWGENCRLICRGERPHPGATLSLFDQADGWRHTAFITNTPDLDPVALETRHRGHARVEDRVRNWKACGLANLPFEDYVRNEAWVAASIIANCLLAWTQLVCLDGDLAKAEPKTLRYRLFHVAARVGYHGRQLRVRLDDTWPWRHELAAAFIHLRQVLP